MNLFNLQAKKALITGATGYLGKEMSLLLAEAGAHVLINSRSQDKCDALVKLIQEKGWSASAACFDITDRDAVSQFIDNMGTEAVDILINNSYAGSAGSIELASPDSYIKSYESSLVASASLFQKLLPNLRKAVELNGYASVINIASMYGVVSPDQRIYDTMAVVNPPFYGAAKAALIQWTKYAACEFSQENIRINCISPGPFPSNDVQKNAPELVKKIAHKVPMGRVGLSSELAGPVLFLASPASSFMAGANLIVDGGWTCW